MTRVYVLFMGALATVIFALMVLVILPKSMLATVPVPTSLKPLSALEQRGREVYIQNGCIYCHTQQVRDTNFTSDVEKGMGLRPSVPADYAYDSPHLLGTMRTGPDLFNVGRRLPDKNWHLLHLYQPRAVAPWSIMPAFPFLFRVKEQAAETDTVVNVPEPYKPAAGVVVSTEDADALVAYLMALKHDYPVPGQGKEE